MPPAWVGREDNLSKKLFPNRAWWIEFDNPELFNAEELTEKVNKGKFQIGKEVEEADFNFLLEHLETAKFIGERKKEPGSQPIVILRPETKEAFFFIVEFGAAN
jgi:hypothetical protein